jgi:hypothetical protein
MISHMRKKSSKDKLLNEFKKRVWGKDKQEDNELLDILNEVIIIEKNSLSIPKKAPKKRKVVSPKKYKD